jgi:hypothetical protein
LKLKKLEKMDSEQKIREFINNEDTKEIVNFLFDLPIADFKFWGGLIKEAYEAKLQEGSGALEALKKKEIEKVTVKLKSENEILRINNNKLTNQLSQEKEEHNEKLKTLEKEKDEKLKRETENLTQEKNEAWNEFKKVRKEKDVTQVKLVSIELNPIWVIAFLFPKIRVHSKQSCDRCPCSISNFLL